MRQAVVRDHQMWSVEMCPCRIFFSRADSSLTSLTGKVSSIKRFILVARRASFRFLSELQFRLFVVGRFIARPTRNKLRYYEPINCVTANRGFL